MASPIPTKSRKKLVNLSQLAEIFEVAQETMTEMTQQDGFPAHTNNPNDAKEKIYSTREVINWFAGFADYRRQKARGEKFKADLLEIEVAEKKKEVIKIEKAIKIWGDLLINLKTNLLRLPKIAGNIYPDITTSYELESELRIEINTLLENLSKYTELDNV